MKKIFIVLFIIFSVSNLYAGWTGGGGKTAVSQMTDKDTVFYASDTYKVMPASKTVITMPGFSDYDQCIVHST